MRNEYSDIHLGFVGGALTMLLFIVVFPYVCGAIPPAIKSLRGLF